MNVIKGIVQIAVGLVVGGLMSDAFDKAVEVTKKVVEKRKGK